MNDKSAPDEMQEVDDILDLDFINSLVSGLKEDLELSNEKIKEYSFGDADSESAIGEGVQPHMKVAEVTEEVVQEQILTKQEEHQERPEEDMLRASDIAEEFSETEDRSAYLDQNVELIEKLFHDDEASSVEEVEEVALVEALVPVSLEAETLLIEKNTHQATVEVMLPEVKGANAPVVAVGQLSEKKGEPVTAETLDEESSLESEQAATSLVTPPKSRAPQKGLSFHDFVGIKELR